LPTANRCGQGPLQIIEVDQPASQAFKRERLGHARVAIPDNVAFCPIDFERTTLQEGLGAAAFDPQMPTFCVWLGVTQYLTLQFVLTLPAPSGIAFTFVLPDAQLEGDDLQAATVVADGTYSLSNWTSPWDPEVS
jgi:hypothetical protein